MVLPTTVISSLLFATALAGAGCMTERAVAPSVRFAPPVRSPQTRVPPPVRATSTTVRPVRPTMTRVASCGQCRATQVCLEVTGGPAPGPGHSGRSTSCHELPPPCRSEVTCDCLRREGAAFGLGGYCSLLPSGGLYLDRVMP